jgi:excinuclease UvrABC nuclease subunit
MKQLKGIAETKNSVIVDKNDFSEKIMLDISNKDAYDNFNKNIPRKSGLYFFYNKEDKCVYVGISTKDIKERIYRHMFAKIGSPSNKFGKKDSVYKETGVSKHRKEISHVRYMLTDNGAQAKMLETYFINVLTPAYNIQENWGLLKDELVDFNFDED